jgi:hypothetical protein
VVDNAHCYVLLAQLGTVYAAAAAAAHQAACKSLAANSIQISNKQHSATEFADLLLQRKTRGENIHV